MLFQQQNRMLFHDLHSLIKKPEVTPQGGAFWWFIKILSCYTNTLFVFGVEDTKTNFKKNWILSKVSDNCLYVTKARERAKSHKNELIFPVVKLYFLKNNNYYSSHIDPWGQAFKKCNLPINGKRMLYNNFFLFHRKDTFPRYSQMQRTIILDAQDL